ncbi:MAG: AraC family transcriptional regulator [Verrucomicrobiota bacterium]
MKSDLIAKWTDVENVTRTVRAGFAMLEEIFDHVPETVFFLKDIKGRYLSVNQTLVERCGLREKRDLLHKHVKDIFPRELAERYSAQDEAVLRHGTRITDRLELHWHERRRTGWCLTTKLPLKDDRGRIIGLVGISRDLRSPGNRESIPASLATTMEHLEANYTDTLSPSSLARHAGLSPVRFARLIKRIFRITPHQLIVQTRLNAAAHQLAASARPVAQIALDCGFYDHSALTRAFRRATGQTPTQFREARS